MTAAKTPEPTTAVAPVAKSLTQEQLNALLQGAGLAAPPSERQQRIKLDGSIFVASDTGEMFVFNPKHPENAAMTVRILRPVEDYNGIWISDAVAAAYGRPDLAGTFSKKYHQPNPDRRIWPSDEVYDDLAQRTDILDDRGNPLKSSWKGDLHVQIVPDSGQMKGDETEYVITLPTTSLIEFRGASKAPEAGSISEFNFIQKLCRFAETAATAAGTDPTKAIMDALVSYQLGGVVAEVRIGRAENKERNQTWPVIIFDPVFIEPMTEGDRLVLASGDE